MATRTFPFITISPRLFGRYAIGATSKPHIENTGTRFVRVRSSPVNTVKPGGLTAKRIYTHKPTYIVIIYITHNRVHIQYGAGNYRLTCKYWKGQCPIITSSSHENQYYAIVRTDYGFALCSLEPFTGCLYSVLYINNALSQMLLESTHFP